MATLKRKADLKATLENKEGVASAGELKRGNSISTPLGSTGAGER